MDQIINELSAAGGYNTPYDADNGMQQLLTISKELVQLGFYPTIRTTRDFMSRELAQGFSVTNWATDRHQKFDRDVQRYFLTYATKSPYIEDFIDDSEEDDRIVLYEYDGHSILGPGLAELWVAPILSLDGNTKFQKDYITIVKTIVTDGADEKHEVRVLNLWQCRQVAQFSGHLQEMTSVPLRNGHDIIRESSLFFPTLQFCEHAKKQIGNLTGSEQFFPEIVRHLRVLNRAMIEYTGGPFDPTKINWSRESRPTMDQFGNCRKFICPDGEQRTFELHSKLISANQRIYFLPIIDEQVVYIGYVGKHLPTVDYRT